MEAVKAWQFQKPLKHLFQFSSKTSSPSLFTRSSSSLLLRCCSSAATTPAPAARNRRSSSSSSSSATSSTETIRAIRLQKVPFRSEKRLTRNSKDCNFFYCCCYNVARGLQIPASFLVSGFFFLFFYGFCVDRGIEEQGPGAICL